MSEWTLGNTDVGIWVIPDDRTVYGDPHSSKYSACQILTYANGSKFGLKPLADSNVYEYESFSKIVELLNKLKMRQMTRQEVSFLLLYTDKNDFAV